MFSAFLYAQTAAEIEQLLATDAVTYGQAARFVLEAADVAGYTSLARAFDYAQEQKWLPQKAALENKASLSAISLLIMRSFGINGGFFYSIFKNSHYAYRELVYQDVIQGISDPGMTVSGSDLLFMVNRVIPRFAHLQDSSAAGPFVEVVMEDPVDPRSFGEIILDHIIAQIEYRGLTDTTAKITDAGVMITLSNLQFLANSAALPPGEAPKVRDIAAILGDISVRGLFISCHTALAGTEAERLRVSQERAETIKALLVSLGVRRADEVIVQGFGSQRPVADNRSPEGMALNRRVEFTILERR